MFRVKLWRQTMASNCCISLFLRVSNRLLRGRV